MQDDNRNIYGRRSQGEREGWREFGPRSGREERRSWEPPRGRHESYDESYHRGDQAAGQGRGGGSYGQEDYSRAARRSQWRRGDRYQDTGWETEMANHSQADDRYAGGGGDYSGYGSSGQGAYGAGGFAQGGYGRTGYGRDYGQDVVGRPDERWRAGRAQERLSADEGGYGQGDLAGGVEAYGGGHRAETWDAEFEPDYLHWRQSQLAGYDRDYARWRDAQARAHDDEYRTWRDERRSKFHEDFHSWRSKRLADTETGVTVAGEKTDPAIQNIADGGKGREDLKDRKDE